MAQTLKSIVSFTGLTTGVPTSLPHGLKLQSGLAVVPDELQLDAGSFTITADTINVTVTRLDGGPAAVDVLCEYWHTFERAFGATTIKRLGIRPFIMQTGGGGGGGGGAPQMTISRFRPAEGDSVNLVANAMNIIDCQDLVFNATLFLPLSADSPAGTPLEIAFVNLSAEAAGLREQFIGITQQPIAIGLVQLACSGSDTCNGVVGGAGASFVKLSDGARLVCDGVLDWAASAASWYNAQTNGLTPPPGNAQLVFAGAVPGILGIGSLAGNTTVIQAISAGYWGQEILIVNDDASHTFKLGTGFTGPFTDNAQPLFGIAAGYTLAVGSSRKLQYAPDLTDTTLGRWFVIGDL